uniref:Uncharacterized protein n=1 Tax=Arundo donax TaxID=35708 RepID=A0A0A9GJP7_ARUDO
MCPPLPEAVTHPVIDTVNYFADHGFDVYVSDRRRASIREDRQ